MKQKYTRSFIFQKVNPTARDYALMHSQVEQAMAFLVYKTVKNKNKKLVGCVQLREKRASVQQIRQMLIGFEVQKLPSKYDDPCDWVMAYYPEFGDVYEFYMRPFEDLKKQLFNEDDKRLF